MVVHAIRTMADTLPDDPGASISGFPDWLTGLVSRGALGAEVRDRHLSQGGKIRARPGGCRPGPAGRVAESVAEMLKLPTRRSVFAALRASDHPQARFLWAIFRDVSITPPSSWKPSPTMPGRGFRHPLGLQLARGPKSGNPPAGRRLPRRSPTTSPPALPGEYPAAGLGLRWARRVHGPGIVVAATGSRGSPPSLPVYRRQRFPEALLGKACRPAESGETLYENAGVRLWRLPEADPGIGILSIKSRMHPWASRSSKGCTPPSPRPSAISTGGDLARPPSPSAPTSSRWSEAPAGGQFDLLEATVEKFQRTSQALAYPGCRWSPRCRAWRWEAAADSCTPPNGCWLWRATSGWSRRESAASSPEAAADCPARRRVGALPPTPNEVFPFLQNLHAHRHGQVAGSAQEAMDLGFVRETDTVVFHPRELLHVALAEARPGRIRLRSAAAASPRRAGGRAYRDRDLEMVLLNMKAGA